MIKENKVSLWLGCFESAEEFEQYMNVSYDEDGNHIPSAFQKSFGIKRYNIDMAETDRISDRCLDVESLLEGFSYDYEIIPQFKEMLGQREIEAYNSIVLLYNFRYEGECNKAGNMEYIGCADVRGE